MPRSPLEADWLQDTLAEVAQRLRRSCEDHAKCAEQLEEIVADLRLPDGAVIRPRSPDPGAAAEVTRSAGPPLQITISISSEPRM